MVIANANFDDRAEYTCNATNEISSANVTILVRVKGKNIVLLSTCVVIWIIIFR